MLLSLDAGSHAPIALHVDSPDGTLEAALVLINVLGTLRTPVRTQCRGHVGTPAIGAVAAAAQRAAPGRTRGSASIRRACKCPEPP